MYQWHFGINRKKRTVPEGKSRISDGTLYCTDVDSGVIFLEKVWTCRVLFSGRSLSALHDRRKLFPGNRRFVFARLWIDVCSDYSGTIAGKKQKINLTAVSKHKKEGGKERT